MNKLWGEWLSHDGSGMPVPRGTYVRVKDRAGRVREVIAGSQRINNATGEVIGPATGSNWNNPERDCWVWLPKSTDIISYQIKRPKGMEKLDEILRKIEYNNDDILEEIEL